ncbi:MAG: DinB family protein [Dehalococcoidia bacterium]
MDSPRDLLARLAATPRTLAHLVVEADNPLLDLAVPGSWSARTVLAHFRDEEYLAMRPAMERMLAEREPELVFLSGDDWEPGRNRSRDRKDVILGDFALQRQASLNILNGLRPDGWERRGRTASREFTLHQLVATWAKHDAEHVAELERLVGETAQEAIARRARSG